MRIRPVVLAAVVACTVTLAAPSSTAVVDPDPRPSSGSKDPDGPGGSGGSGGTGGSDGKRIPPRWQHSSDGVRGEIAPPLPRALRGQSRTTTYRTWKSAPGVTVTSWDEPSGRRGPVRAHLMTVALGTPGLSVDYAYAGVVRRTAPLTKILARHRAIAGVNGDFFDIGDTGAPLGLGQDQQEGLLNARATGWNAAFSINKSGRPDIGTLPMVGRVKQRPHLPITNVNSAFVQPGGIGIYTADWGYTSGYAITDGQQKDVRMVRIVKNRVVEKKGRLTKGKKIRGVMLVARGAKASRKLARMKKGEKAVVRWWLKGSVRTAITGNKVLIRDGVIEVVDDREMHPRTAIGFDRDTNQLLFLTVDGRQSFSRGYTMVELANRMSALGADEALNLDGGGSSTMVARRKSGAIGVVNSPSDGRERSVPNGLEIAYTPPSRR